MRIWSKKLIPVLPTKQLKAMRYELGDMIKQYPNIKHPLVKFANNYDMRYLAEYYKLVHKETKKRKINTNSSYDINICVLITEKCKAAPFENTEYYIFKEDNEEYLMICKYNLYEKYLRCMITKEEWEKIEEVR